jgi:hypothetical protein
MVPKPVHRDAARDSQDKLAESQENQTRLMASSGRTGQSEDAAQEQGVPTFEVQQTHLPDEPSALVLHVAFEGLKLFHPEASAAVQVLPYEDITRFRRLKEGAGLALTLQDGSEVTLTSETAGGSEIYATVQAKVSELAKMLQTDSRSALVHMSAEEEAELAAKYLSKAPGAIDPQRKDSGDGDEPKKSLMRRFSVSLAPPPPPPMMMMGGSSQPSPHELAAAQASTEAAMENLVEAQAALRHKVSALMRAGDTEYLAAQMPELQAKTANADKEYKKSLAQLPDDLRFASERRLRELLDLDEEAARKEDAIKDAAPAAVKRKMAKAARSSKVARRYSVAVGSELAPIATVPTLRQADKARSSAATPTDVTVTFEAAGALGISWTSVIVPDTGESMAAIKAVKPGSVADRDGHIEPGMLLATIGTTDMAGADYFDIIRLIRERRPLELGLLRPTNRNRSSSVEQPTDGKPTVAESSALDDLPLPTIAESESDDGQESSMHTRAATMSAAAASAAAMAAKAVDQEAHEQVRTTPKQKKMRGMSVVATSRDEREAREHDVQSSIIRARRQDSLNTAAAVEATCLVTFAERGPLGIIWSQASQDRGGADTVMAVVKAVKPGSVAERDGRIRPGMVLTLVGETAVSGLDYFDQIRLIRVSERPLQLGLYSTNDA